MSLCFQLCLVPCVVFRSVLGLSLGNPLRCDGSQGLGVGAGIPLFENPSPKSLSSVLVSLKLGEMPHFRETVHMAMGGG